MEAEDNIDGDSIVKDSSEQPSVDKENIPEVNNKKLENPESESVNNTNETENVEKDPEESGRIEEENDSKTIDYDDEEDSGDEFEVITKPANEDETSSPGKNLFSIKTISNMQSHNNYKLSRTAVDLNHPGNISGVPTLEYDLSKLVDEFKPWKKPGADITDYFNYGFTEETWLSYCDKQKNLRLSQDNSALKTLSGFQNFGYPLSGSHIHLGMNRGGQGMDMKGKHDMGLGSKISTIPVQTGGLNLTQNQSNNLINSLTNSAMTNNPLNQIMSAAMAMGFLPNSANVPTVMQSAANLDGGSKMNHFSGTGGGNMDSRGHYGGGGSMAWNANGGQTGGFERATSVDSMHSHEDYGDRRNYPKHEARTRREDKEDSRRHRSRDRRDRSPERRKRSRSRDRDHETRSIKKAPVEATFVDLGRPRRKRRSPDDLGGGAVSSSHHRKHKKRSRERRSSSGGSRRTGTKKPQLTGELGFSVNPAVHQASASSSRRRHHARHRRSRSGSDTARRTTARDVNSTTTAATGGAGAPATEDGGASSAKMMKREPE